MSRRNRNQYQSFNQGRQNGWGIGLYRHPRTVGLAVCVQDLPNTGKCPRG